MKGKESGKGKERGKGEGKKRERYDDVFRLQNPIVSNQELIQTLVL